MIEEPAKTIQDSIEDVRHIISLPSGVYRVSIGFTVHIEDYDVQTPHCRFVYKPAVLVPRAWNESAEFEEKKPFLLQFS